MSSQTAGFIDSGLSIVGSLGGAVAIQSGQTAAFAALRVPESAISFGRQNFKSFTKSNLQLGRQMHQAYKLEIPGLKEYRLPSGRRIDFLDPVNGIVYELKPNNPRAIRLGQKQLELYLEELKTMPRYEGTDWKTILETY